MAILKELLADYRESYEAAKKLISEESKTDPQNEPYRSHYKARTILENMMQNLKNELLSIEAEGEEDSTDALFFRVILATVYCKLGRVNVFVEETSSGEELLNKALTLLAEHKSSKEAILPYLRVLNEMATIYANRQDYQASYAKLIEGESLYFDYKKSEAGKPWTIYDILCGGAEIEAGKGETKLESLYTHCTFYLAQIYGHLGELEKSAHYCHLTLKRQLEAKSFDSIDFALNAATLSQYFIGQNKFPEARHHLAAATYIMDRKAEEKPDPEMSEQQKAEADETFKHRYADIARCWSKYGLALLTASKEHLFQDDEGEEDNLAKAVEKVHIDPKENRFPDMDLSAYEKRVTDEFCLTFDDAKKVYHFTIHWLDKGQEYYTPETEASEYAKIIKDYAELYDIMAFYEEDPKNQCKMQKRRAKYYEDLLELLNPVFYLNICRECWYGAALAYTAVFTIKLDKLKENNNVPPKSSEIRKINQANLKCISFMQKFVETYTVKNTEELQPNLAVDDVRLVLFAYFRLAHSYFKLIANEASLQYDNLSTSLKYYQLFLKECANHEEAAQNMQSEIGVSKDIEGLLPLQLANIQKRMAKHN